MFMRRILSALLFSAAFIATVSLLGAAISRTTHQPINQAVRGPAGLPGIEVVIVKKGSPGAKPQSVMTDNLGRFSFDVLPAGTYALTLRLPEAAANRATGGTATGTVTKVGGFAAPASLEAAGVTITGTTAGSIASGWDFKEKKQLDMTGHERVAGNEKMMLDPKLRSAAPTAPQPDILFTADGKQKVTGTVHEMQKNAIRNMR